MALAPAATETFLAAVTPVGEKILLNFNLGKTGDVPATWNVAKTVAYDFVIQQNYVVTGLSVTKTVESLGAGDAVTVIVSKVDQTGLTEETICAASITGALGVVGCKVETGAFFFGTTGAAIYQSSSATDPLTAVAANIKTIAGTANSQQRIRVRIVANNVNGTINPDCFIEVQLAKFVELDQGASATKLGVQFGELITPALVG